MIIITMKRLTMDGEPLFVDADNEGCEDPNDWWGVIETKEEELVYDLAHGKGSKDTQRLWNYMVNHAGEPLGLAWGDDDIYGYFRPDEMPPEVGDEFTDGDGDKWIRVE